MSFIGKTRDELCHLARFFSVEALCSGGVDRSINRALEATGHHRQRKSPLQPKLMMWLIICLPIFRSDSIPAVLSRLLTGLREFLTALSLQPLDDDALCHARKRMGVRPLRRFFQEQAAEIRPAATFHGLRTWCFDGTTLTMPDTDRNRAVFGLSKISRGRPAFPQLKMVVLQDAHSRRFRDVRWGLQDAPERPLALPLLTHLGEGDLLLLDRGFYGVWFFEAILRRKCHFLVRVSSCVKLKAALKTRKKSGDYLAWIQARVPLPKGQSYKPRVGRPGWHRIVRLLVRVIEYQIRGFEKVRLVTSLTDSIIPALDLAQLYHRRWDIELAFDELKTHQSSTAGGTLKTIFRSCTPRNVMQEAYALLAAYNLVRSLIAQAAQQQQIAPDKISFVGTLRAITHMLPRMKAASSSRLPALYQQLVRDVAAAKVDRPRRPRRYPRVVKVKMSNFKLKRSQHQQEIVDLENLIRITA